MTGSQVTSATARDGVEPDGLLERVPDLEQRVLAELRADQLQPDREPSESPHGIESPGRPARHEGIVSRSPAYIASGSAARSPIGNATVGEVGDEHVEAGERLACSSMISVRTFCAWP